MSEEIISRERSVEEYVRKLSSLEFPASLDRSKYVFVPSKNKLIAFEQSDNGLDFHATRECVAREKLFGREGKE